MRARSRTSISSASPQLSHFPNSSESGCRRAAWIARSNESFVSQERGPLLQLCGPLE